METTTNAYPEYVENEYTEQMWVRRDLADTPEAAVAYIVAELGLESDPPAYDVDTVTEVRMRLYPPDHPDAPDEARREGADYFKVEADGPVAYWQMRP